MAGKRRSLFDIVRDVVSDTRTTFRVYFGKTPTPPPPTSPPITTPQQGERTQPDEKPIPWEQAIDTSIIYKAGKNVEIKESGKPDKPFQTQYEKWQEQQAETPKKTEEEGNVPLPKETESFVASQEDQGERQEEGAELPYFPISRRQTNIPPPLSTTQDSQPSRETEKIKRKEYLAILAARPQSALDIAKDQAVYVLSAFLPFGRKPVQQTPQAPIEKAIAQFASAEHIPLSDNRVQYLYQSAPALAATFQQDVLDGQPIRDAVIIPLEKYEEQRFNLDHGRYSLQPIALNPQNGIIRFLSAQNIEQVVPQRLLPVMRGVFGSLSSSGKMAVSSGVIAGKGLVAGGLRGAAVRLLGLATGVGGVITVIATSIIPKDVWRGILVVIVGIPILLFFFTVPFSPGLKMRSSLVGGGAGDVLAKGNQYISIEISSSKSTLQNSDLPTDVVFKITVKPRIQPFIGDPKITGAVVATGKNGSKTIVPSSEWTEETHEISAHFEDLEDVNAILTVNVSAQVADQTDTQNSATNAIIRIGNPPDDCPIGWPTDWGQIIYGPNDSSDPGTHSTAEAVDIGNSNGKRIAGQPAYATHKGIASTNCFSTLYGNCVRITTTCNGKTVYTIYAHLMAISQDIKEKEGVGVVFGQQVGVVGATGNVFGADPNHLHYEFLKISNQVTIPMAPPYIPLNGKRGITWEHK